MGPFGKFSRWPLVSEQDSTIRMIFRVIIKTKESPDAPSNHLSGEGTNALDVVLKVWSHFQEISLYQRGRLMTGTDTIQMTFLGEAMIIMTTTSRIDHTAFSLLTR